jgi:predicted MPP superfamily phosphohydrolase
LLAGGAVLCALRWQAWFGMPAEPKWNGETIDYVFQYPTAERSNSETVLQRSGLTGEAGLTVLILGDIHSRLTRAEYDTLAARVPQIDAVAQIGDWMDRGQNYYYQLLVREWTNSALNGLPVIACPGNHEYTKGLNKQLSPVWEHAFAHPDNGPIEVPGASYFVDMPSVRFIVIDTNPLVRMVYLTRTLTWLEQALKTADGRFTVVLMHHPVLSVGKGRANVLVYSTFRHALSKADLVLAGHDHSYMRRTPFVVLNTAGKTKTQKYHYTPEVTDTVPVYGVLQSSISNLQFNVYRLDDNTLIDSLYVKHD